MKKISPLGLTAMKQIETTDKIVVVGSKGNEANFIDHPDKQVLVSSQRVADSTKKTYVVSDWDSNNDKTLVLRVTVDTKTKTIETEELETLLIVGTMNGKAVISSGINTPEAFGLKPFGNPYHPIETIVESDYKPPTMRSNIKKGKRK